jgi:hypothetical protein
MVAQARTSPAEADAHAETSFVLPGGRAEILSVETVAKGSGEPRRKMVVRGFCSTNASDIEADALPQDLLDLKYVKHGDGGFRWKHTPKPGEHPDVPRFAKVGKVTRMERRKTDSGGEGTWVEGFLYDDQTGREIFDKALAMQAAGDSLGMSIEGTIFRDKRTRRPVKVVVRHIAIDPYPINPEARVEMAEEFAKSMRGYAAPLVDAPAPVGRKEAPMPATKKRKPVVLDDADKACSRSAMAKADDDGEDELGVDSAEGRDDDEAAREDRRNRKEMRETLEAAEGKDKSQPIVPDDFLDDLDDEDDEDEDEPPPKRKPAPKRKPSEARGARRPARRPPAEDEGDDEDEPEPTLTTGRKAMPSRDDLRKALAAMPEDERQEFLSPYFQDDAAEVADLRKALQQNQSIAAELSAMFGADGDDGESIVDSAHTASEALAKALGAVERNQEFMDAFSLFAVSIGDTLEGMNNRLDSMDARLRDGGGNVQSGVINKALGVVNQVATLLRVPAEPVGLVGVEETVPPPADAARPGAASGAKMVTRKQADGVIADEIRKAWAHPEPAVGRATINNLLEVQSQLGALAPSAHAQVSAAQVSAAIDRAKKDAQTAR